MPLKRNWECTYFFVVEENNFPNILHMAYNISLVSCATLGDCSTSLRCGFIRCKREMVIVPPSLECYEDEAAPNSS